MEEVQKIALFIDADNISAKYGKLIMSNLEKRGEIFIRRIYGNWEKFYLHKWNDCILTYGLNTVHQIDFSTGKNATDMTLAIDAMDVLYKHQATIFAIVSNDSDFTPLAVRLREHGVSVIGIGSKVSSVSFRNACNEFMLLDSATEEEKTDATTDTVLVETTAISSDASIKPVDANAKIAELERKISLLERQISEPKVSAYVRMTAEENKNSALQTSTNRISQRIIIKTRATDSKVVDAEKPAEVEKKSADVEKKSVEDKKPVEVAKNSADVSKKVQDVSKKSADAEKVLPAKKVEPVPNPKVAAPKIVTTTQKKKSVVTKNAASSEPSTEKISVAEDKVTAVELKPAVPAQIEKSVDEKTQSPEDLKKAEHERTLNERFIQCGQNGMRNPKKKMQQIHDVLRESARLHGDKDGFVPLTFVGQDLNKKKLGFTVKDFGYTSLNEFIGDFPDLYELTHTKPRSFRYRCI
ncbi:MAG: NYN domain-containing protein [Selenomonadaceae bacterium]|nr:NYN domain-containing protein [Selenomonadaceae bacterium]